MVGVHPVPVDFRAFGEESAAQTSNPLGTPRFVTESPHTPDHTQTSSGGYGRQQRGIVPRKGVHVSKKLIGVIAAALLALGVAPAFADHGATGPGGSTEHENEVECGEGNIADEGSLSVSGDQSGSGGYLEVCNDGDTVPLQGRIIGQGDAQSQDGSLCADGDATNEAIAEQLGGWACLQGDGNGNPTIVCANDGGSTDSQVQDGTETTENCLPSS